jgi:hypothetical protein
LKELAKIANEDTVRLDVLQGHVTQLRLGVTVTEISQRAQEQLRELLNLSEAACEAVAQQSILKALAFSDMYGRFEDVEKAHFDTFGWIYGDKPSPTVDPDIVESLYHDDSDDNQSLYEDSSTEDQPRHEDNADTSSQRSRSKEEKDIDSDDRYNGGPENSQDSVNEERKEREISPSRVPEKQHQKDNQKGKDDAFVQREKWINWLSSGNGIFHIAGKLGSGKSTLMKFLCNHPQTKDALQKWAGMFKLDEK